MQEDRVDRAVIIALVVVGVALLLCGLGAVGLLGATAAGGVAAYWHEAQAETERRELEVRDQQNQQRAAVERRLELQRELQQAQREEAEIRDRLRRAEEEAEGAEYDPHRARERALEEARESGLLGRLDAGAGDAPAGP